MPKPAYDLQLHRPNILVADMERALGLYRDILGFKVDFLLDALDVATEMFALPADVKARMAFLSEGKGVFGSACFIRKAFTISFRPFLTAPPHLFSVAIYKRVQILIADVWACCEGQGYGEFSDIDTITMFADYRYHQSFSDFFLGAK